MKKCKECNRKLKKSKMVGVEPAGGLSVFWCKTCNSVEYYVHGKFWQRAK